MTDRSANASLTLGCLSSLILTSDPLQVFPMAAASWLRQQCRLHSTCHQHSASNARHTQCVSAPAVLIQRQGPARKIFNPLQWKTITTDEDSISEYALNTLKIDVQTRYCFGMYSYEEYRDILWDGFASLNMQLYNTKSNKGAHN